MNSLFRTITSSKQNNVVTMTPQEQSMSSFEMMEKIHIDGLEIEMNIGVPDQERTVKQTVIISVELDVETNEEWQSDSINDVVSYANIIELIEKISLTEFKLVETMAKTIIAACYDYSALVQGVSIKIDKPDIFDNAQAVGCMIESYRNS